MFTPLLISAPLLVVGQQWPQVRPQAIPVFIVPRRIGPTPLPCLLTLPPSLNGPMFLVPRRLIRVKVWAPNLGQPPAPALPYFTLVRVKV